MKVDQEAVRLAREHLLHIAGDLDQMASMAHAHDERGKGFEAGLLKAFRHVKKKADALALVEETNAVERGAGSMDAEQSALRARIRADPPVSMAPTREDAGMPPEPTAVTREHIHGGIYVAARHYDALSQKLAEANAVNTRLRISWREDTESEKKRVETAESELAALREDVSKLEGLVYVPGVLKCAKCSCVLITTTLYAETGQFSADSSPKDCPNGCGPMWRRTERDAGNELCDRMEPMQIELAALRALAAEIIKDDPISGPPVEMIRLRLHQDAQEIAHLRAQLAGEREKALPETGFYLQDRRKFVGNDMLWWAKDGNGYTTDLHKAHVFSEDEMRKGSSRETDVFWPVAYINSHARPAVDHQHTKRDEVRALLSRDRPEGGKG